MMSTFQALGLNVLLGSCVCLVSLGAFASAVHFEYNALLAPRTWARPRDVIKNVLKRPYGISWISWALDLSYRGMLEGIDGTGTRKNGWSGTKLNCNLDGIVAVKFNALCLRVALFATLLCCVIVLPLNWTAPCDPNFRGEIECQNRTQVHFNRTTLAFIPAYEFADEGTASEEKIELIPESFKQSLFTSTSASLRLFGVVAVAWCIYVYACGEYKFPCYTLGT